MKPLNTFKQLQYVLELLESTEEVLLNKTICKFRPKTATYSVSLAFSTCRRYAILTFKSATSYPCIFVGTNIDSCINKARTYYDANGKF